MSALTRSDLLRRLAAGFTNDPDLALALRNTADYIEMLELLACDRRDSLDTQIELRVEAEARAGRLAREARR